ncbi:MAG: NAD-dependent protein deacylase [Myxococcales bacterium]|nr:NAD-dependent protein deacylase [Myxococcales bacterium]
MDPGVIAEVGARLASCRSILFITGAGVSAASGLPTYRGIGGLYEQAQTADGVPIEVALSGEMLRRRPELTWKYIGEIERAARGAQPNDAHRVLASFEPRFERVWTLTQNVDGLHRAGGSEQLIEIHGDVHRLACMACGHRRVVDSYAGLTLPPRCPACGDLERPEVVLFGEQLPEHAVRLLTAQLALGFDAVLSIGTSSVFPYIAEPVLMARRRGALTVEVNPGDTEVSPFVEVRVQAPADAAMNAIGAATMAALERGAGAAEG